MVVIVLGFSIAANAASCETVRAATFPNNPNFITGHPEKVNDFGYRAVHEMTVIRKFSPARKAMPLRV